MPSVKNERPESCVLALITVALIVPNPRKLHRKPHNRDSNFVAYVIMGAKSRKCPGNCSKYLSFQREVHTTHPSEILQRTLRVPFAMNHPPHKLHHVSNSTSHKPCMHCLSISRMLMRLDNRRGWRVAPPPFKMHYPRDSSRPTSDWEGGGAGGMSQWEDAIIRILMPQ